MCNETIKIYNPDENEDFICIEINGVNIFETNYEESGLGGMEDICILCSKISKQLNIEFIDNRV